MLVCPGEVEFICGTWDDMVSEILLDEEGAEGFGVGDEESGVGFVKMSQVTGVGLPVEGWGPACEGSECKGGGAGGDEDMAESGPGPVWLVGGTEEVTWGDWFGVWFGETLALEEEEFAGLG